MKLTRITEMEGYSSDYTTKLTDKQGVSRRSFISATGMGIGLTAMGPSLVREAKAADKGGKLPNKLEQVKTICGNCAVGCGFVAEGPEMITVHRVNQPVRRNQPAAVLPPGLVTDLKDFLFMHAPEDGGDRVGIGFGASVSVQVFEQDFILGIPPSHRPVHGDQLLPAQVVQEEMGLFHVLFCLEFFSRHMHLARRVVIQGSLRTGFLVVSDQQRDILPRYPQCLTDKIVISAAAVTEAAYAGIVGGS